MKQSRSEFLQIRGLRYHLRSWGPSTGRPVFVLHGWLDVSATWQHVADALPDWRILAPDWRGFGLTDWSPDTYWFPDYVADLDAIVRHYGTTEPVDVIGHSMGSQVASLFAGARPDLVRKLVCLDGFYVPNMEAKLAPGRMREWLDKLQAEPRDLTYPSFEELAARIAKKHPRLSAERALFVARCWGEELGEERIRLCADPRHRQHGPMLYRAEESQEIWRQVSCPVLALDAETSYLSPWLPAKERKKRLACFKNLTHKQVPECGHMMHFDAPVATAQAIAAFLDDSADD